MPNHVHLLIEPLGLHAFPQILKGGKGASAREANRILGVAGRFWLDESFDHIVRSEAQYQHFVRYIVDNPVKAGLREAEYWLHGTGGGQTGMSAPLSSANSLTT